VLQPFCHWISSRPHIGHPLNGRTAGSRPGTGPNGRHVWPHTFSRDGRGAPESNCQRCDKAVIVRALGFGPGICYSYSMAKQTQIILIDDLSGETIADGKGGTVTFGLDGVEYAIDLTDKNADKLRTALSSYVAGATRVGRKSGTRGTRSQSGPSAREVRDWARSNGFKVPDRGRIPNDVREAFDAK
jgi:hypothetical protein